MDKDEQDYYESLFSLFITEGWQAFISDHEEAFEHLTFSAARDCTDTDSWQFRRGYLAALEKVLNFEKGIRNHYDAIEKDGAIEAQWEEVMH